MDITEFDKALGKAEQLLGCLDGGELIMEPGLFEVLVHQPDEEGRPE